MGGVGVVHRPEAGFVCEWGEPEEPEAPSAELGVARSPEPTEPLVVRSEGEPAGRPRPLERVPVPIEHWMTGEPTF